MPALPASAAAARLEKPIEVVMLCEAERTSIGLAVTVATTGSAWCRFLDPRHADSLSNTLELANLERDLRLRAASHRSLAGKEAAAMDVQAFLILREDEAEVLLLVEPEHLTMHDVCLPFGRSAKELAPARIRVPHGLTERRIPPRSRVVNRPCS